MDNLFPATIDPSPKGVIDIKNTNNTLILHGFSADIPLKRVDLEIKAFNEANIRTGDSLQKFRTKAHKKAGIFEVFGPPFPRIWNPSRL